MQYGNLRRRAGRNSEQGYILLIFLVVLTMMMIALTAAAPRLVQQIKRDREIEMIHRGDQYSRAIKRFYKKFGRYPGRVEDLENTNTLRFLRKRYTDPITGGPWRLVRFGEIQMSAGGGIGIGTPAAALGQAANNLQPGAAPPGAQSGSGLFNLNFGGTPGQQGQTANTGPQAGITSAAGTTSGAGTTATGATDASLAAAGTTDSTGQTGLLAQNPAAPGQTTSSSSSLFSSPASSAQPGMAGGGTIIGVASLSKANGIHEFNQKSAFKDWFFIYDPGQDRGQLLRGPYNPQAFFGAGAGPTPPGATPAGQATPGGIGAPGATPSPNPGTPSTSPGQSAGGIVPSTQ